MSVYDSPYLGGYEGFREMHSTLTPLQKMGLRHRHISRPLRTSPLCPLDLLHPPPPPSYRPAPVDRLASIPPDRLAPLQSHLSTRSLLWLVKVHRRGRERVRPRGPRFRVCLDRHHVFSSPHRQSGYNGVGGECRSAVASAERCEQSVAAART